MQIHEAVELLGRRQQGLVTAAQLAGLVSRSTMSRALLRGELVQPQPKVYALAALPVPPRQPGTELGPAPAWVAHVRAVLLSVASSAAAGRTAAALRGWGMLVEPGRSIDLVLPNGGKRVPPAGTRLTQVRGLVVEFVATGPGQAALPVTDAVTTVLTCCLGLALVEAVVVCDSALRAGDVTVEELRRSAGRLTGLRRAARALRVVGLCDPDSGSVLESVLRVRLAVAGVGDVQTQVVLRDGRGRHVLRADFCFPAPRLVVEVDGARWHPDAARDRHTDNALVELGWRVLRYSWSEVVHGHAEVVRQVIAALDAAVASTTCTTRSTPRSAG